MIGLVVQRDPRLRQLLCERLSALGAETERVTDAAGARKRLRKGHVDVVISDLDALSEAQFEFLHEVRRWWPDTATIGFAARKNQAAAAAVISAGIDEYLSEPDIEGGLRLALARALRRRDGRAASSTELERIRTVRAVAADKRGEGDPLAEQVLERLARAGRFRDEETAEHVERMSRSCALIARRFGWDAPAAAKLRAASAMHDIGKVGVPDSVLRKPGKLNADERARIEEHAEIGHHILTDSGDELLEYAATVALTHQERFDGSGYPRHLEGVEIPLAGRIAAVADVFDALTHDRIYRRGFKPSEAAEILHGGRGSQFDPGVIDAFEAVRLEIGRLNQNYPDSSSRSKDQPLLFVGPELPPRVLLVGEQGAIARGLELLLRREGIEIAGSAKSVADGCRLLERRGADVLVVDPAMEGGTALKLLGPARARGIKVLLYTDTDDASSLKAARRSRANAVVPKSGSPGEFVEAIQALSRGGPHIVPRVDPGAQEPQTDSLHHAEPEIDSLQLTPREREIAALLADGLSGAQIAERLFLSPETVRTHIRNAMGRAGAQTRAHLAALAVSHPSPTLN